MPGATGNAVVVIGAGLAGSALDRAWLLRHADAIEGHPDNVAAAVYGGFVLAYNGAEGVTVAQSTVADDLAAVVFVPETSVSTHLARGLLPGAVPHRDAAANSGRAALFVHAMATNLDVLLDATRDWLHQEYRRSAMPESYELMEALRKQGHAAVISGAGPTVLVVGRVGDLTSLTDSSPAGFRSRSVGIGTGVGVVR